jgi:hypothetical protein
VRQFATNGYMTLTRLIKKVFGISAITKSRIGFMLAFLMFITFVEMVLLRNFDLLHRHAHVVCIALGVLGFLFWLAGAARRTTTAEPDQSLETSDDPSAVENPLNFLWTLKAWGVLLTISAAALSCVEALTTVRNSPVVMVERRTITITLTNVVTITNVAVPVAFPALDLQGVVVNGSKSAALINGRVVALGEAFSNAVLVALDAEHAVMAKDGETKVLSLRK